MKKWHRKGKVTNKKKSHFQANYHWIVIQIGITRTNINTHLKSSSISETQEDLYYSSHWLSAAGSWHFLLNMSLNFFSQRTPSGDPAVGRPGACSWMSPALEVLKAGLISKALIASNKTRFGMLLKVKQRNLIQTWLLRFWLFNFKWWMTKEPKKGEGIKKWVNQQRPLSKSSVTVKQINKHRKCLSQLVIQKLKKKQQYTVLTTEC